MRRQSGFAVVMAAALASVGCLPATEVSAQAAPVGSTVNCNGNIGTVVGTEPRAGWDEPFTIVRTPTGAGTSYDLKCLAQHMKPVPGGDTAAPAAPPAPRAPAPIGAPAAPSGATVNCNGNIGTVVGTEPRMGWDEPFTIVRVQTSAGPYDLKCLAQHMKPAPGGDTAPPGAPPAPAAPQPAAATPAGNAQCRPGAKLEGLYGNNWYAVTVLSGPDAAGWCPVRFDGYGPTSDRSVMELRPRGSGQITRPERPVADGPAPGGAVPDGRYSCSKIQGGGGNYIHFGDATIRGGRVTGLGLPDGWTIVSVARGAPNGWSQTVASVTYRTKGGDTDLLECIPQ